MTSSSQPISVLHVDDEGTFLEMAADRLERKDDRFVVTTATSATDGLEHLADGQVDCVLSDYDMPGMDGLAFLKAVRDRHPALPFILLTGRGSEEVASKAISAGVTDYLQKGGGEDQYSLLANRIRNAVAGDRAQQERPRHLKAIETAQEGISILDPEGQFIYVNESFATLYGYEPAELLGADWELLYPSADVAEIREEAIPEARQHGFWRGESVGIRADGDTFIGDHTLSTTEEGGFVCTVRDITDQTERRRELREERWFIDQALDVLRDVFCVIDPNGVPVRWNQRLEAVTGFAAEELSEMDATEFFHPGARDRVAAAIEEALHEGQASVEADIRTADGERIPYELIGGRLTDSDGNVIGMAGVGRDISDRRDREVTLEQTSRQLEAVLDTVEAAIFIKDRDGRYQLMNQECRELLGVGRDETVVGMTDADLLPADVAERFREDDKRVMAAEKTIEIEEEVPTPAGAAQINRTLKSPFYDADGELVGVCAVSTDVTAHKERHRTLEQYRRLVDALPDPACILDRAGRYELVNEALADLYDTDPAALVGQRSDLLEAIGDDHDDLLETLVAGERDQLRGTFEYAPGGTDATVVLEYHFSRLLIEGEFGGVVGIARDVTGRIEREQEIAFFAELVEQTGAGIAAYGADGRYEYVNEAYAELLGTDPESLEGTPIWRVNPAFDVARFEDYWNSFEIGETRLRETTHSLRGTEVPVQTVTTRLEIRGAVYHLGTITDISERKAYERELERQNERLEAFARIVSHDLQTPLTVAQGRLRIARKTYESENLDIVAESIDRMQTLLEDLLTLAREGERIGQTEPVRLGELVGDTWVNVDTGDAELVIESDQTILANPSPLQQLFENLFRNAIEHVGPSVTVTVGDLPNGFYLQDDGPGIPTDERADVLELGYSTDEDGTGFGLSIVEQIAAGHGWSVDVTAAPDGGARFEFTGVSRTGR